jgi:deoxyribose-phosphate aldolase
VDFPIKEKCNLPVPLADIPAMIDQTLLKPDATEEQIRTLCSESLEYKFAAVCVHPVFVSLASGILHQSSIGVGTVVGFPTGAHLTEVKILETQLALAEGAREIDMVINIGALKSGNYDLVKREMKNICDICAKNGALCKVIIETAFLTETEKRKACEMVIEVKPAFIKTSTGFAPQGATEADVRLMSDLVKKHGIGVKAAGGIRDFITFQKMVSSGATRIGTSSGVQIIREAQEKISYPR